MKCSGKTLRRPPEILQIALTTRDKSKEDPMPMCGIPYFAAESYISKLIKAGHKVAVCEQMEDPRDAKGIVASEIVRVITPGTHTPEHPKENTYICKYFTFGKQARHSCCRYIDRPVHSLRNRGKQSRMNVNRFEPKEILMPLSLKDRHPLQRSSERFLCLCV